MFENILQLVLVSLLAYVTGSIPTGYIVVKTAKNEDIGKIGAKAFLEFEAMLLEHVRKLIDISLHLNAFEENVSDSGGVSSADNSWCIGLSTRSRGRQQ